MQPIWDFYAANKDAVDTLLKVFSFLGLSSIAGAIGWVVQRGWKQRVRTDNIPVFEVISDSTKLLPRLLRSENNDNPLADHNIEYQERDPDRSIRAWTLLHDFGPSCPRTRAALSFRRQLISSMALSITKIGSTT